MHNAGKQRYGGGQRRRQEPPVFVRIVHDDQERGLVVEAPTWMVKCVADPTVIWPWHSRRAVVTLADLFELDPITEPLEPFTAGTTDHLRRIAYFVRHPSDDPIALDVWPGYDWWPIIDGNHRLFAAVISRRPTVPVAISGDVSYAAELLGVAPEELAA